jgi:hypothetical protein
MRENKSCVLLFELYCWQVRKLARKSNYRGSNFVLRRLKQTSLVLVRSQNGENEK